MSVAMILSQLNLTSLVSWTKQGFVLFCVVMLSWTVQADAGNYEYLASVTNEVKRLRIEGATNHEIADFLTNIIGNRVRALNRFSYDAPLSDSIRTIGHHTYVPSKKFHAWRDMGIQSIREVAVWTWENRVGQCQEHAVLTYYILREAGIDSARILGSGDHVFVCLGLEENQSADDIANPHFWPDDALVVDTWQEKVLTPREAFINSYIADKGRNKPADRTYSWLSKESSAAHLVWNTEELAWECEEPYVWDSKRGRCTTPCPNPQDKHLLYDNRKEAWYCNPRDKYKWDETLNRCVCRSDDILGTWEGCDGRVVRFTLEGNKYIGRYQALGGLGAYHFKVNEIGYRATRSRNGTYTGKVKWRWMDGKHKWKPITITISGDTYTDTGSDSCSRQMKRH